MILGIFILFVAMALAIYGLHTNRYDVALYEATGALFALGFFLLCWDTVSTSLR